MWKNERDGCQQWTLDSGQNCFSKFTGKTSNTELSLSVNVFSRVWFYVLIIFILMLHSHFWHFYWFYSPFFLDSLFIDDLCFWSEKKWPAQRRPFLFSKTDWPAASRWRSLRYLDQVAGHRLVPTELGKEVGAAAWKEDWGEWGWMEMNDDEWIWWVGLAWDSVLHYCSA